MNYNHLYMNGFKSPLTSLVFKLLFIFSFSPILSNNILNQLRFDRIDVESGLPNSNVNCIFQDNFGYIWIGTEDGLARYDGSYFRIYNDHIYPRNLGYQAVISIYEADDSTFLVGTRHTLELYNRLTDNFLHFTFPPDPWGNIYFQVSSITKIEANKYLIGTDGGGLFYFFLNKKEPQQSYLKRINKNIYRISSIYLQNKDTILVADFSEGLFRFLPSIEKWEEIKINSDKKPEIRALCIVDQFIYAGSENLGLFIIDKNNFQCSVLNVQNGLPNNRVWGIAADKNKNIWIGTDGGGLIYYQPKTGAKLVFQHHGFDQNSISNNLIHTVYVDRYNNLWLGHYHGGVSFANTNNAFHSIRSIPGYENSLSNKMVTAVLHDSQKNLWVGTDGGGINIYDTNWNRIEHRLLPAELINNLKDKAVISIYEDSYQNILIGTYLWGFYLFNLKTRLYKNIKIEQNSRFFAFSNDVRCFFEDTQGQLWVGTNGSGIYIFDKDRNTIKEHLYKRINSKNTLSLNWIKAIVPDSYGFIWIATSFGLNRYDPVKREFVNYFSNKADSGAISDDLVLSIFEDSHKNLWVGTRYGLNLYNRERNSFKKYFSSDGLANNTINSITQDRDGNIWLATNYGITLFDIENNKFVNYTRAEGLISSTFLENAVHHNDKFLYFGSIEGLLFFNPADVLKNYLSAPLKITRFFLHNKEIDIGQKIDGEVILTKDLEFIDELKLKFKHNSITLHYSPLSYTLRMYTCRYKLEGFNTDWSYDYNGNHSVSYTNLDPGKYRFVVQMLDKNNHIISEASLKFSIIPPFWLRFWFKIAIAIIVLFIIYSWYTKEQSKWEVQKAEFERRMAEEQLKIEKAQLKLQEEKLLSEKNRQEALLASKNSELTTIVLQLSHKNDILQKINNLIEQNAPLINDKKVKSKIEEIGQILKNEFATEKDWERLEKHFNEVHADFIQRLKKLYPDLGLTQLRLCAYLKLDLSTKELAFLLNISPRGVEKARSRLRKRFNLPPNASLTEFLNKI